MSLSHPIPAFESHPGGPEISSYPFFVIFGNHHAVYLHHFSIFLIPDSGPFCDILNLAELRIPSGGGGRGFLRVVSWF